MQTPCVASLQLHMCKITSASICRLALHLIAGLALSNSFPKTGKQRGLLHQETDVQTDVQRMNASFSLLTFCYHFFLYLRKATKLNTN